MERLRNDSIVIIDNGDIIDDHEEIKEAIAHRRESSWKKPYQIVEKHFGTNAADDFIARLRSEFSYPSFLSAAEAKGFPDSALTRL